MRWKLRRPFAFEGKEKKGAISKLSDRIQEIHSFLTIGLRWLFDGHVLFGLSFQNAQQGWCEYVCDCFLNNFSC